MRLSKTTDARRPPEDVAALNLMWHRPKSITADPRRAASERTAATTRLAVLYAERSTEYDA